MLGFHFKSICFNHKLLGEIWMVRKGAKAHLLFCVMWIWQQLMYRGACVPLRGVQMEATTILNPTRKPRRLCFFPDFFLALN